MACSDIQKVQLDLVGLVANPHPNATAQAQDRADAKKIKSDVMSSAVMQRVPGLAQLYPELHVASQAGNRVGVLDSLKAMAKDCQAAGA